MSRRTLTMRCVSRKPRRAQLVATLLIHMAALAGCSAQESQALRIGTSSIGSTFYGLAVAISELIQEHENLNSTVEPVGGSVANVFALDTNRIDLAVVNAFATFSGFNGIREFDKPVAIRLVMQGQFTYRHLLVRKSANIVSPADLVGKTIIGERPANPDFVLIMDELIRVYGLPRDEIRIVSTTNTSEALRALRVGSVDGALLPFSAGSALVQQALNDDLLEFLVFPLDKRDQILRNLPAAIQGTTIKGGTFINQERDIPTFSLATQLVARRDVPEETVYRVLTVLLEHHAEFVTYQSAAREWTLERTLSEAALPYHDGAIRYFREHGLWNAELASTQELLAPD